MTLMLGRLPHDPSIIAKMPTLMGHDLMQLEPPPKLTHIDDKWQPGMYGNDEYPDCTAASWLNTMHSFATTQSVDLNPDNSCALPFYASCIGMPDATQGQLALSQGARMTDVLQYQWRNGCRVFSGNPSYPIRSMIGDFYNNNAKDMKAQCLSMWKVGAVWWGITLTQKDMDTFQAGDTWDDNGSDTSPTIGGHAIAGRSYLGTTDLDTVTVFTWGKRQPATWRWVFRRMEESHSVLWRQLILLDQTAGVPIDYDQLSADCRSWALAA